MKLVSTAYFAVKAVFSGLSAVLGTFILSQSPGFFSKLDVITAIGNIATAGAYILSLARAENQSGNNEGK
jgi:hypothetical protein